MVSAERDIPTVSNAAKTFKTGFCAGLVWRCSSRPYQSAETEPHPHVERLFCLWKYVYF